MDTLRNVPQYIAWHIRIFLSQFVAIRCAYGRKFRQNFTCIYWFFQFFLILWRCKIFLKLWREYQLCFTKSQVFLTTCECWFSCNTALNFLGMAAKSAIGRYLDIVEFSNWRFYRPLDGVYCSTNCSAVQWGMGSILFLIITLSVANCQVKYWTWKQKLKLKEIRTNSI